MSDPGLSPNAIINLSRANVVVIDDNVFSQQLLMQMLQGFGVRSHAEFSSTAAAKEHLSSLPVDLIIVDCEMPEEDGYDFVRWLRRSKLEANVYAPVIMLAGHTKLSKVTKARDCGANFIVARPLAPSTLLDRIVWIARESKPYLEAGDYIGPDRRVREGQPPVGVEERRADMIAKAAEAAKAEMQAAGDAE
jgi:DNA-binding response OmpR family regulator